MLILYYLPLKLNPGYWHEQSRVDRDLYIKIIWDNIVQGKENQFEKCEACDNQGLNYDTGSIMHYHAYAFSKDRKYPTIIPSNDTLTGIGQRNKLSDLDIEGINKLYCPGYASVISNGTVAPAKCRAIDKSKKCVKWKNYCDSKKWKDWMAENCALSCGSCSTDTATTTPDKCMAIDHDNSCPKWKGYCKNNKWMEWMAKNCALSCKTCSTKVISSTSSTNASTTDSTTEKVKATTSKCVAKDIHSSCVSWKKYCNAKKWRNWMARNCALSCNICDV